MATRSAAIADLSVNLEARRADEKPGSTYPSLQTINSFFTTQATLNPALTGWQSFNAGGGNQAESMCRGQSHRRDMDNLVAAGAPAPHSYSQPSQAPSVPVQVTQPSPVKLRVAAEERTRVRRTAEQKPTIAVKATPSKSLRSLAR